MKNLMLAFVFQICARVRIFALFTLLICSLVACMPASEQQEDYSLGVAKMQERDLAEAQMHFERYLRLNPEGRFRWEAWQNLIDITLNYRNEKSMTINYLEVMLLEYENDLLKKSAIKMQMAGLANAMRQYDKAVALWESMLAENGLSDLEKSTILRHLSKAYLRRMEFTQATAMLNQCVNLTIAPAIKADCVYELAETQTITGDLEQAVQSLRKLLAMAEARDETKILAAFLLADVLEQTGQKAEALKLFEGLQGKYPNERVIAMRIDYIKNGKISLR